MDQCHGLVRSKSSSRHLQLKLGLGGLVLGPETKSPFNRELARLPALTVSVDKPAHEPAVLFHLVRLDLSLRRFRDLVEPFQTRHRTTVVHVCDQTSVIDDYLRISLPSAPSWSYQRAFVFDDKPLLLSVQTCSLTDELVAFDRERAVRQARDNVADERKRGCFGHAVGTT